MGVADNYDLFKKEVEKIDRFVKIIVVTKNRSEASIIELIKKGHIHFGENKVQEVKKKWLTIRENHPQINLHMIGRLQTNKVKFAVSLFDYIHTVDNQKLVHYLKEEEFKQNKKLKYFIQVNIGQEPQKSGIFEKKYLLPS